MATFHLSEIRSIPDVGNDLSSSDDESFVVLERGTNSTDFTSMHNDAINKEIVEACAKAAEEELQRLSVSEKQISPQVSSNPVQVTVEEAQSIPDDKESVSENSHHLDMPDNINVLEELSDINISLPVVPVPGPVPMHPKFENDDVKANKTELLNLASIDTMSSAFSPEEIQAKVDSLIEENAELKERIARDNSMFDKILKYKKDTETTFEINQKQFAEATSLINELKEENKKLKEQVDALTAKSEQQIYEVDFWKKRYELDEKTLRNLARENMDMGMFKSDAESRVAELEKAVNELTQANEKLARENTELGVFKADAESRAAELETTVNNLIQKNEKLQAEMVKLGASSSGSNLSQQPANKEFEKDALYKSLSDQITYLESLVSSSNQTSNMLKLQLANSQRKLTDCEYMRNHLQECLKDKNEEIVKIQLANDARKHFESQSSGTKYTDDDFYALQTQLEVYRNDFEAERSAKETFRTEKNQLAEDLQHIQVRNRELQEEIELMRGGGNYVHVQGTRRQESAESTHSESTTRKYSCPKCSFAFTTFDALNNHVHRCLDLNESLP